MTISRALKKFSIVFSLLCFTFLFGFLNIEAVSFKYIWQNTTVTIPLGKPIEDYRDIPSARLYRNGIPLDDSNITYNTEGDWLYYFKDINPYKVGSYYVWYKAYDSRYRPGTCTGYKALINFVVKDLTMPDVTIINPIYYIQRGSEYNLANNYYAYDNYELKEIKVDDTVNKDVVGDYTITVTAFDSSNNQRTKTFTACVYETSYPEIIYELSGNTIEVPLNQEYDIKALFKATDKVDGDITNKIVFDEFINDKLTEYDFNVNVTNNANLTTTKKIHIKVVDLEAPKIELLTHQVILDYKTSFINFDFKAYIKEITDNQDIDYDNLKITHNIKNETGTYEVNYKYSDGTSEVEETLEVILVSYDKPTIDCEDIYIGVGETIDILDYANINDESDSTILDSVVFLDSNVSYDKAGTYYADIYCMNSSGISNTQKVKIIVEEKNVFSSSNLSTTIIMFVLIIIIVVMAGFLIYYFFIRKIHNKKNV